MSTFGTGSTTTAGASITLTAFEGTNGVKAGTDGLVPGPSIAQEGYLLGAGGDWTLNIKGGIPLAESSDRVATTEFVQDVVGNAVLAGNAQLSALADVTIAALADDQFLQYDAGSGKWQNTTLTLSLISDVNLAGLIVGNTIVWDGAEWVPGVGGGGGANNLTDLGDVTIAGGAEFHFLVRNNAGQYVNRLISSTDLSNSANIVLKNADALFGANTYDFTGVTAITVPAPTQNTHASTKKYVDDEINDLNLANTYQAKDSSLDDITGIADGDLLLGDGANSFEKISVSAGVETLLKGTGSVGTLSDVDLTLVGNGKILKYDGGSFVAVDETDTNTQLTDNQVKDIVGGQMLGGTETGITVTYDAVNRDIDFVVSLGGFSIRDLSDVSNDALINGKILKVVAGVLTQADETDTNTQLTDEQVQDIVGDMVDGGTETDISVTYDDVDGKLDFVVSADVARLASPALTGVPTTPTANQGTDTTQIASTEYVQTEITTLNLGTASQKDVGVANGDVVELGANGLPAISGVNVTDLGSINILSDVDTTNKAEGKVLKFNVAGDLVVGDDTGKTDEEIQDIVGTMFTANNAGNTNITFAYDDAEGANDGTITASVSLASTDLTNTANISLLDGDQTLSGDKVFTGAVDLTGATATAFTQANGDDSTNLATTAFVKAVVNQVGNISDLDDLTDVTLGGVALAEGQVLRVSNDNSTFVNSVLSFGDLSGTGNVVQTDAGDTFGAFAYDFTASTVSVNAPTQDAHASTKLYVDTQVATKQGSDATLTAISILDTDENEIIYSTGADAFAMTSLTANARTFLGTNATINDLSDVLIDGVANAQVLVYDSDAGVNDNQWKNVSLSGDITISNAGVSTIENDAITTIKILDANVTNAKLENAFVNLTDGANIDKLNLGETITFTGTVNEVEVATTNDVAGANAGATITIGLPSDVTIGNDLIVAGNLTVNGTTTTINTTDLDIEDAVIRLNRGVDGEENGRDVGIFMERGTDGQDAIFYFDEGEDIFKLGTTTSAHTTTDFDATTTFGTLKLATLTATSDSTIGGTLEVTQLATFTGGLSANDQNITNVQDIALDTISAVGTTISISMTDKIESAFKVAEGGNDYITVDTSDGAELITFEKNVIFNGTTNITANFDQAITINESGNAVDFRVEGDAQTHLLYTDGTNDRVGINTDTPDTQFHVNGDTKLVGGLSHSVGAVAFNTGLGDFDFRVAGDNQANLLFVDASTDRIGIHTNTPSKTLDVVGTVEISSTLDVTGKTTLAGSLDLTTGSATGITFRSEIGLGEGDADQTLLRVNIGEANPKSIKWVSATDLFEVESGLKSTGDFTVGNDLATINSTTGVTSIGGATTINNAGGTSDLIVQNNGSDVLNVDVSAGLTTITGIATVSSQLKTDDLRGLTAGTGNFKVRLEDNLPNALEISDATNALSFMTFTTTDDSESITLSQDTIFKKAISIESTNTNGLFFNTDKSGEGSADATLITIERGTDAGTDVVLAWDTTDHALNLNPMAQMHLQGRAGSNALTIGGALVANATIVMTTEGAITLDGTLDSPTINTDKITDRTANGLEVELADATPSALVIRQGANESYLTINTDALTTTLNQATSFSSTVDITGITTLNDTLKINKAGSDTGIIFNADRANGDVPNGAGFDATLIHVEDGTAIGAVDAYLKWDDSEDSFKIEGGKLFSATEISVGTENAGALTKNFTVSTNGSVSAGAMTATTPADASDTTDVPTTEWVRDRKLGDFNEVDTSGFNANDQILVWDQDNGTFKKGDSLYNSENARDDVATALIAGNASNTGATSIVFSHDDANDLINLALGITTEDLTDVSSTQATNNQVLRFTTAVGDDQNKYVPTTLGTSADVDTGLNNGEIPTLTTHYYSTKTNETADLVITGRIIESIDYGSVSEEFNANDDFTIDFGLVNDTVLYCNEDYGVLVV